MKSSLNKRPQILNQYQRQIIKIQQIKRIRQNQLRDTQLRTHDSHKLLTGKQHNTIFINNPIEKPPPHKSQSFKLLNIVNPNSNFSRQKAQYIKHSSRILDKQKKKTLSVKQYLVQHDNLKLQEAIRSHRLDKKQYKTKLRTQVSQYEKLRQHMQRFKNNKLNIIFSKKIIAPKTQRKSPQQFRKFLTQTIQQTRRKMSPHQFQTEQTRND